MENQKDDIRNDILYRAESMLFHTNLVIEQCNRLKRNEECKKKKQVEEIVQSS